MIGLIEFV